MKTNDRISKRQTRTPGRIFLPIAVGTLILGLLAIIPGAWALPEQAPDFQTVPTLTPTPVGPGPSATPTEPGVTATATQPRPTTTPTEPGTTATPTQPGTTATPTRPATPATPTEPVAATNTSVPGATPTQVPTTATPTGIPGTATPTGIPGAATPTVIISRTPIALATPTRLGTAPLVAPNTCLALPTPGFQPVRLQGLEFEATSDQGLVVPGQALLLRLTASNRGGQVVKNVVICNPLDARLQHGKPITSQGRATLVPEGLVVELGDLAPGKGAKVELPLTIPPNYPLGGVIEDQAWLLAEGQQASTGVLTWALPPAYLPPTGS